jgi:hypothetical protein
MTTSAPTTGTVSHRLQCVHPDATHCLAQRHQISTTFADCMGGCNCPCHYTANGVQIPYGAWVAPGSAEPIGTSHAIDWEKMEAEAEDAWLL